MAENLLQRRSPDLTANTIQLGNDRGHDLSTIYYCQCRKYYLSFPALYLHARIKHNVKFTTKMNPTVCKIEEINNKRIITYYIKSKDDSQILNRKNLEDNFGMKTDELQYQESNILLSNEGINSNKQKDISEILREFQRKQFNENRLMYPLVIEVLRKLKQYFNQIIKRVMMINQPSNEDLCKRAYGNVIPTYFNDFIVNYLKNRFNMTSRSFQQICFILERLGKWMLENNYSEYYAQLNSQFHQ